MKEEDRVRHKKYGLGTVLRLYPKNNAVRVKYDSGHVTVNAQARVQVIRDTQATATATATVDKKPAAPTQPTRRRGGAGETKVDYDGLERARVLISSLHPDADHVVPRIYGTEVYCEVWKDGSARTVFLSDRDLLRA